MKITQVKCDACGQAVYSDSGDFQAFGEFKDCNGKVYDICVNCQLRLFQKVATMP